MGNLADFTLHLSADPADCRYLIDGQELRGVLAIQVTKTEPTDLPIVHLQVQAGSVKVTGEGASVVSLGMSAAEFLEDVDAEQLSKAALAEGNYGTDPIKTALEILKARAYGAPS